MQFYPDLAQLLIILVGEGPSVWRRVHVSAFAKLGGLHHVIQAVMGWDDRLPHRFILNGDIYQRIAPGEALDSFRERNWRLDSALYPDKSFLYEYGPSDKWLHRIIFEDYVSGYTFWRYPRCVGGAGVNPLDSGTVFDVGRANRKLWRAVPRS